MDEDTWLLFSALLVTLALLVAHTCWMPCKSEGAACLGSLLDVHGFASDCWSVSPLLDDFPWPISLQKYRYRRLYNVWLVSLFTLRSHCAGIRRMVLAPLSSQRPRRDQPGT